MSGVVNVGGGESRGGECRTINQPQRQRFYRSVLKIISEATVEQYEKERNSVNQS